jgi:uncharacterized membrane protein
MPFCPNCGASVDGKFCPACGKPVADSSGSAPNAAPQAGAPASAGMQDNVAGALAYVFGLITGILFLVLEPYSHNRAIRFHAFQSIFLNIAVVVVYIVLMILSAVLGTVVPVVGMMLMGLVMLVLWLGVLVLWLLMIIKTYSGSKIVLPVIGPMAEKQA